MLKHVPLYLAIALATACSSDSDSSSSGDPAFDPTLDASGDPDLDLSGEPGPPASDTAPSNDALLASGGEVTIEQAADLSLGRWTETRASTGCTTTYVLDDGVFQKTSLDQTAAGFYDFFDDDGGVEIEFDYEQDNFGSDCRGFSDNTLEDGVSYLQYITFPDRDTMVLSASPGGRGFAEEYERQ